MEFDYNVLSDQATEPLGSVTTNANPFVSSASRSVLLTPERMQAADRAHVSAAIGLQDTLNLPLWKFISQNYRDGDSLRRDFTQVLSQFRVSGTFNLDMDLVQDLAQCSRSVLETLREETGGQEKLVDEIRAFDILSSGEYVNIKRDQSHFVLTHKEIKVLFNPVTLTVDNATNLQLLLDLVGLKKKIKYKYFEIPVYVRMAMYSLAFLYDFDVANGTWRCTRKSNMALRSCFPPHFGNKAVMMDELSQKIASAMRIVKFGSTTPPEWKADAPFVSLSWYYSTKGSFAGFPGFESVGVQTEIVTNDLDSELLKNIMELQVKTPQEWAALLKKYDSQIPEVINRLNVARTHRTSCSRTDKLSHNMFSYAPGLGAMPDRFHDLVRCLKVVGTLKNANFLEKKVIVIGAVGHQFVAALEHYEIPYIVIDTELPKTGFTNEHSMVIPSLFAMKPSDLAAALRGKGVSSDSFVFYTKVNPVISGRSVFEENRDWYDRIIDFGFVNMYFRFDYPHVSPVNVSLFTAFCDKYKTVKIEPGIRMHNSECWVLLAGYSATKLEGGARDKIFVALQAALKFKACQMLFANASRNLYCALGRPYAPVPLNPLVQEYVDLAFTIWNQKSDKVVVKEASPIDAAVMNVLPDFDQLTVGSGPISRPSQAPANTLPPTIPEPPAPSGDKGEEMSEVESEEESPPLERKKRKTSSRSSKTSTSTSSSSSSGAPVKKFGRK